MIIILIIVFIYVDFVSSFSHPCNGTDDILYEVSDTESFCLHNFGDTQELKDEFLYSCAEWFHLATGASVHSDRDRDFLLSLAVQFNKPVWTGLIKLNNNNNCDPGGLADFSWDDGTEVGYITTNGNVVKDCSYSRDYCFVLKTDGVWEDTSCDTRGFEALCFYKIPICDGINATNYENVCNGHGVCFDTNECECDKGYYGTYCGETHTCDSIRQDNTSTCSGKGKCTSQDNCVCDTGYFGDYCGEYNEGHCYEAGEFFFDGYCYKKYPSGYRFDEAESLCQTDWESEVDSHLVTIYSSSQTTFIKTNILSDQMWLGLQKSASSTVYQPCPPNGGYTWIDGTSDDYALSRGSSISCDSDTDMCFMMNNDEYFWVDVDCAYTNFETVCMYRIPRCQGEMSNPSICSGHGRCVNDNNCSCFEDYYGKFCSLFECWGVQVGRDDVCSGHGSCMAPDWCICDENYLGDECNMTTCNDISSESADTCGGHGECIAFDVCACSEDYGTHLTFCNHTYPCQDTGGGDTYVSGSVSNYCAHLFTNYLGYKESMDQCKAWFSGATLFHVQAWDEFVWMESQIWTETWHGLQKVLDENAYFCPVGGTPSTVYWADGYNATWINNNLDLFDWICNEVTRCFSFDNPDIAYDCPCPQLHPSMCRTEIHECFGIMEHDREVCNGNGFCLEDNACTCKGEGYVFQNCSVVNCFGVPSNQIQSVCAGHGDCIDLDVCTCDEGWAGTFCQFTSCNGIWTNDSSTIENMCRGHGTCESFNDCICDDFYLGIDCETTYCDYILSTDEKVCSGRAVSCYPRDNCTCTSSDYSGQFCEITTCYGIPNLNSMVCNSGGDCVDLDDCECEQGFYYGKKCEINVCSGILSNDTANVCSGKGNCTDYNTCTCNSVDYFGEGDCDQTTCFGVFMGDSKRVCSGHGDCWPKDVCYQCDTDYFGKKCEITTCGGVMGNYSAGVCNGHGDCWPKDNCFCTSGNYYGSDCNIEWSGLWMGMMKFDNCVDKNQQSMKLVRLKDGDCYTVLPKSTYVSHTDTMYFQNNFETKNCSLGTNSSTIQKTFEECSIDATYFDYYSKRENFSMIREACEDDYQDSFLVLVYFDGDSENQETCESIDEPVLEIIEMGKCINKYSKNFMAHLDSKKGCEITISTYSDLSCTLGKNDLQYSAGECVPDPFGGMDYVSVGWIYEDDLCSPGVLNSTSTCEACDDECFGIPRFSQNPKPCSGRGRCLDTDLCGCDEHYFGEICNITKCDGKLSNDSSSVCGGHGECWPYNHCECDVNFDADYCDVCNEEDGYYGSECTEFFNSSLNVILNSTDSTLFLPYVVPVDISMLYMRRSDLSNGQEFDCGERIKNWEDYKGGPDNWPEATCFWILDDEDKSWSYGAVVTKGIVYQINHDSPIYKAVPDGQTRVHDFHIHLCTESRNITLQLVRSGAIVPPTPPPDNDDDGGGVDGGVIAGAVAGGLAAGLLALIVTGGICGGILVTCLLCMTLVVLMAITIFLGCGVLFLIVCSGTTAATTAGGAVVVGKEVHDEVMDEGPDFVKDAVKERWEQKQKGGGPGDIELDIVDLEEEYITDNLQEAVLRQDDTFEDPEGLDVAARVDDTNNNGEEEEDDGYAGIDLGEEDSDGYEMTEEEKKVMKRREVEFQRKKEERKEQERQSRNKRERLLKENVKKSVKGKMEEVRKKEMEDHLSLSLKGTRFARKKKKLVEKKLKEVEKGLVKEKKREVRKIEKEAGMSLSLKSFEKKKRKERKGLAIGGNII